MMSYTALGHWKLLSLDDALAEEKDFIRTLYQFMRDRESPIERIPSLGFKQLDLFAFYKIVEKLGGYEQVTLKQVWRQVYNELGANPHSTSAATCTRKHYEKLLLPYERHLRGEEEIPASSPRTLKRCYRSMFKETLPEKPVPDVKKTCLVESPSWKDMPTSNPHNVNRFVLGYLPQVPAYEQLWKQQELKRAISFSTVRDVLGDPLAAQSVRRLSSDNSNHISGDQRGTLNRRLVETSVMQSLMELSRHQANDDDREGQELPLNLSSKRRVSEPSGSQDVPPDPSPRFLNHVSTLYPPHHIQKIEGPLKDQIQARKPSASERASELKNMATSARAPLHVYLSNTNRQNNLKKDCLEDAKSGKYTSLDLTSGRACMIALTERPAGCHNAPVDNGHHSLPKALPRALAKRIVPAAQYSPTAVAWPVAAKSESHCKVSQVNARPICKKTEPQQQTQTDLAPSGAAYVFSYPLMKQKNLFHAGTCSTVVAASTKPKINPAVHGTVQEDHPSAFTTTPAFRMEMTESRNSFPGSYQLNNRRVPTPTGSCRGSALFPVGLINAVNHFEQHSLPGHTSSLRPAHESMSFENMLQRRSEMKPWREPPLANGQRSLEVNLPRVERQLDLCYSDIKSKQVVSYVSGALQKYLPLESHLKQVSGACFVGRRQTISSPHQGLGLWTHSILQRDGLGPAAQEVQQVQTFSPPVVS